jgi:hypothetical protein
MNSYEFSTNYDYEKTLGNLRLVTPDNHGRYDKAYDPKWAFSPRSFYRPY